MSEFTEILKGSNVVGASCRFGINKSAKVYLFPINSYTCLPFSFFQTSSFVFNSWGRPIRKILGNVAGSEIMSAIVESVVIAMVNVASISCDLLMHKDGFISSLSLGVKVRNVSRPHGCPIPLHQPIVISGIHDGVLALGERYKFDRLIKRLDDFVSDHTTFLHGLTSDKIVRHSAAFAF